MKQLDGLRAILSSQTYGPVDPACSRDLRVAVMTAASGGLSWAGDASADRQPYGRARNIAAHSMRCNEDLADGVMWVDSDIRMKPDAILRLLTTVVARELDFVTGVYHTRAKPYLPVLYHWDGKQFLQAIDYPTDTIISAGGCGFGFVWTSAKTIRMIAEYDGFDPVVGWFPDKRDAGGFGEDLAFCDLARRTGVQLFVDTGVIVGHTTDPQIIWAEDFRDQGLTATSSEMVDMTNKLPDRKWGKPVK